VLARNVPWPRLLDAVLLAHGLGVRSSTGGGQIAPLGQLAQGQTLALAPIPRRDPTSAPSSLTMAPAASLRLVAVLHDGRRPVAALEQTDGRGRVVRQGDRVALERFRVAQISPDSVVLEASSNKPGVSTTTVRLGQSLQKLSNRGGARGP